MNHSRIGWRLLPATPFYFLPVIINQFRLGTKRRMNGELPVVQKERLICISFLQPLSCLFGHPVLNMFTGCSFRKIRIFITPRSKVTSFGSGTMPMRKIDIKTMFQGRISFSTQVPFPKVSGLISIVFQNFPEGGHFFSNPGGGLKITGFLIRYPTGLCGYLQPDLGEMGSRRSHSMTGRILTG